MILAGKDKFVVTSDCSAVTIVSNLDQVSEGEYVIYDDTRCRILRKNCNLGGEVANLVAETQDGTKLCITEIEHLYKYWEN